MRVFGKPENGFLNPKTNFAFFRRNPKKVLWIQNIQTRGGYSGSNLHADFSDSWSKRFFFLGKDSQKVYLASFFPVISLLERIARNSELKEGSAPHVFPPTLSEITNPFSDSPIKKHTLSERTGLSLDNLVNLSEQNADYSACPHVVIWHQPSRLLFRGGRQSNMWKWKTHVRGVQTAEIIAFYSLNTQISDVHHHCVKSIISAKRRKLIPPFSVSSTRIMCKSYNQFLRMVREVWKKKNWIFLCARRFVRVSGTIDICLFFRKQRLSMPPGK